MNVFNGHLKSVETSSLGNLYFCTKSFRQIFIHYSVTGCKNANTCFIKYFSSGVSLFQSLISLDISTSSTVQNDASAFYTCSRCHNIGLGK